MDSNNTNNDTSIYPLDELLDSLGFLPIDIYIYQIIIPIIGSLSILLSLISIWILYDKKFSASTYDYFRIITLSHIIQLAFAIPYGVCFTPKYFPKMDSYSCAIVQSAYIPYSLFTSHFDAILEIAILFERIKIMNPFVKKHFTITPQKMILITFISCLLFNSFYGIVYFPFYGGDFYYSDRNGTQRVNSFWFVSPSELAESSIGVIALIVFYVIRDVLTLITTITLNIISMYEMSHYFKTRSIKFRHTLEVHSISRHTVNNSTYTATIQNKTQASTEKNHIKLVLTMCLISILTRSVMIVCDVYYLFSLDYIATLLGALSDLVLVVGPCCSFFVFYYFNRDFKSVFGKMVADIDRKFREIYIE
jgi:hypothetical protein